MRLPRVFSSPRAVILSHANVFHQAVSPVQRRSSTSAMMDELEHPSCFKSHIRRHALFPFLVFTYVVIDTIVEFGRDRFHYKVDGMRESFHHKIYVRATWEVTDAISAAGILMSWSVYGCFLYYPGVDRRAVMYVVRDQKDTPQLFANGKAFEPDESAELYQFFRPFRRMFRYTMYAITALLMSFYNSQVLVFNFHGSLKDYIVAVVVPIAVPYLCYSNFALIVHFIITARCIGLRGRRQIAKLEQLIRSSIIRGQSPDRKSIKYAQQRRTFRIISAAILRQHEEIRLFNAFWSRLLTDYFLVYVVELCYFAYSLLFLWSRMHPFMILFNNCLAGFFIVVQTVIVNECRALLHNNSKAFKLKREFLLWSSRFDRSKQNLFKFDAFEANQRRFVRTGFCLLDGLLLNSRMFQMLLLYTSTLFMMICKHKKPNL